MNWNALAKEAEQRLPDILIGTGMFLNALAVVEGIRKTPMALDHIRSAEDEKGDELTTKETVQAVWKDYIFCLAELAIGEACIIGGAVKYHKRNVGLMALCSLGEATIKQYQEKLAETLGSEKAEEIAEKIVEDKLKETSKKEQEKVQNAPQVTQTSAVYDPNWVYSTDGCVPCFDEYSGRIFYSKKVDIERAVNEANKAILDYDQITLNEYYYQCGLDPIDLGNDVGWMSSDTLIDVAFGSHLFGDIPYLSVRFKTRPKMLRYSM